MKEGLERQPPDNKREVKEMHEPLLAELLRDNPVVNEGREGYIIKVDRDDLSEEQVKELTEADVTFTPETNVKVLKVYSPGKGRRDFEITRQAQEALASRANAAQAPRALTYGETHVTSEIREKIPNVSTAAERVEAVIMEYVPGKDFAISLYYELAKLLATEEAGKIARMHGVSVEELTEQDLAHTESPEALLQGGVFALERYVGEKLGFVAPAGIDKENEAYRMQRAMSENIDKMKRFMERKHVRINQAIFEKVENAVKALHAIGIHHNDLHERNIVVDGPVLVSANAQDQDMPVYIIDFGISSSRTHAIEEVTYGQDIIFSDDLAIVNRWGKRGQEKGMTQEERAQLREKKKEIALRFREELRAVQADEEWKVGRVNVWRGIAQERAQLSSIRGQERATREKILRGILARVEAQIGATRSTVPYEDRVLDIAITLAVANPDARDLIDFVPITVERRTQARRFLDTHAEL